MKGKIICLGGVGYLLKALWEKVKQSASQHRSWDARFLLDKALPHECHHPEALHAQLAQCDPPGDGCVAFKGLRLLPPLPALHSPLHVYLASCSLHLSFWLLPGPTLWALD